MSDIWKAKSVNVEQTPEMSGAGSINRPVGYDSSLFWDPVTGMWLPGVNLQVIGGGRYNQQVIVIGRNSAGKGVVYYK